jgi:hypothetical protein
VAEKPKNKPGSQRGAGSTPVVDAPAAIDALELMPLTESLKNKVNAFRRELLRLHKVLLDDEKLAYEKVHGPIGGVGRLLELVMSDPWFDWLHRISELVVQIDEAMEDSSSTAETAQGLLESGRALFRPAAEGQDETAFMKRYKESLRREPGAVLAHAQVQRALLSDA